MLCAKFKRQVNDQKKKVWIAFTLESLLFGTDFLLSRGSAFNDQSHLFDYPLINSVCSIIMDDHVIGED